MTKFVGRWRIEEMEVWGLDALDLVVPAHISLGAGGLGCLQFIAIEADVDYRVVERNGEQAVEFSWIGHDDNDAAGGRGWAVLTDNALKGRIFIHNGDESAFIAKRDDNNVGS